nr:FHA domain-containing protein [Lachnospiraceae bacterium]
ITKDEFKIGRNPDFADYVVNNPTVGRFHLVIIKKGVNCFAVDMNSKNGTFINGVRIKGNEEVLLEDGCTIRIGKVELIYHDA